MMARLTSVAALTVKEAVPFIPPNAAVTCVVPAATPVATPDEAGSLLIVAVAELATAQWVEVVTSCEVVSLNVAVAVKACCCPAAMEAVEGLTVIAVTVAGVTVRSVVPVVLPLVAVMTVVPAPAAAALPCESIDATEGELEVQLTVEVRSSLLPSLYCPVAVNCRLLPATSVAEAGVMVIAPRVALVMVTTKDFDAVPFDAVIVVVPGMPAWITPSEVTVAVRGTLLR